MQFNIKRRYKNTVCVFRADVENFSQPIYTIAHVLILLHKYYNHHMVQHYCRNYILRRSIGRESLNIMLRRYTEYKWTAYFIYWENTCRFDYRRYLEYI